ncbi:methyltransferase family protein [Maribacter hydrothermalis]|uniref:Protein-S-isoprenylcysteine methyltransferase n=1 Tax=Maribacter hydrothermalis TaxID=1836467 RepID=A0A1B7Z7S4_9FLAO|nr:isoprenylcysteine carboxylmethyltransferase family protein [Maribacter hydrothermalis]APQ15854.1 protein-S-isoprenylcysteine methyltransferase [Maribacter hydrothermalis]OBR38767.1 protein-S-isoprenylcysteine methyltransferase [Maribacter hydrothermalis]
MELKLPPAIVFLFFGLTMYILASFLPFGFFDFFGRILLVKILIAFGVLIAFAALFQFYIAKTIIDPTKPNNASKLVVNGVFKFSRNPMYLAMLVALLAFGVFLGNAFNTLVAAAFVGYMNRFQIIPEERVLLDKFGRSFKEYCTLTRRWF